MDKFLNGLPDHAWDVAIRIVMALVLFAIGQWLIKKVLSMLRKSKFASHTEPTLRSFLMDATHVGLYILLILAVITVLGIPNLSVTAILASCGVGVGLAMQGSLANFAGGMMLMFFKPFEVGDYIATTNNEGTVKDITMFYTVLRTVDNVRVMIPNGQMMNNDVKNFTKEKVRRVDLTFPVGGENDPDAVIETIRSVVNARKEILSYPDLPFVGVSDNKINCYSVAVKVWVDTPDYWNTLYALRLDIEKALKQNNIYRFVNTAVVSNDNA